MKEMNNIFQDDLITEIQKLLFRKYPNYGFRDIFQDENINFPGAVLITIAFFDMNKHIGLWVKLVVSTADLITMPNVLLIENLITRIDFELAKLKDSGGEE